MPDGTIFLKYIHNEAHKVDMVTAVVPGHSEPLMAQSDHPNFQAIKQLAEKHTDTTQYDFDWVVEAFDINKKFEIKLQPLSDRVTVQFNRLYFDGDEISNGIVNKILDAWRQGNEDWRPFVRFLERLMTNPTEHSREQLYRWLDRHHWTLTQDGYIVGYKSVKKRKAQDEDKKIQDGWESISQGQAWVDGIEFNGSIPNYVGAVITMPRSKVNHDPKQGCSVGLHVAAWNYATTWTSYDAVLEVHIDPRDVVSVPMESSEEKVRVCRYKVIGPVREAYKEAVLPTVTDENETNDPTVKVVTTSVDELIPDEIPEEVWDDHVKVAKTKKRGLQSYLESQGYELIGSDPKVREHWKNN